MRGQLTALAMWDRIEPVIMSAGELEHEWAGTPGKLIRERYRKAADMARARGRLSCLLINDIDAGIGHFGNTQLTVLSSAYACCEHLATAISAHCLLCLRTRALPSSLALDKANGAWPSFQACLLSSNMHPAPSILRCRASTCTFVVRA